jgi:hypothetical protein
MFLKSHRIAIENMFGKVQKSQGEAQKSAASMES